MKAAIAQLLDQPCAEDLAGAVAVADSYNTAHPKKRAFLIAYSRMGNISAACTAVGIGRRTHYDWMQADTKYADAFEQAGEDAADALEAEARRRAFEGSDVLLIFLLKGHRPERFRERYDHRHHVGNGDVVLAPMKMPGVGRLPCDGPTRQ